MSFAYKNMCINLFLDMFFFNSKPYVYALLKYTAGDMYTFLQEEIKKSESLETFAVNNNHFSFKEIHIITSI